MAVVFSAQEKLRTGYNCHFIFRQNSDFYYLTGFQEPESIAVFVKGKNKTKFIMFCRDRDLEKEQWFGFREGQKGAVKNYGADEAYSFAAFEEHFVSLIKGQKNLYYAFGREVDFDLKINQLINSLRINPRSGVTLPLTIINPEKIIHEMRLLKSSAEIKVIKKAAKITANAHKKAMKVCCIGWHEYELEAELTYEYRRNGCTGHAFNPIVAAGDDSCILHYEENRKIIRNGELVLVDSGGELENYAADITRTFPANGKFNPEQKTIYNIVLKAQAAALKKMKPGVQWIEPQKAAIQVITEELVKLGILKGNVKKLIEDKAYFSFYMHNVSHWIGLDTHDAGSYIADDDQWRKFSPGMVMSCEPGLYIKRGMKNVDKKWQGIGVRIEDDVLITKNGHEILTSAVPKTVEEIEALMNR